MNSMNKQVIEGMEKKNGAAEVGSHCHCYLEVITSSDKALGRVGMAPTISSPNPGNVPTPLRWGRPGYRVDVLDTLMPALMASWVCTVPWEGRNLIRLSKKKACY